MACIVLALKPEVRENGSMGELGLPVNLYGSCGKSSQFTLYCTIFIVYHYIVLFIKFLVRFTVQRLQCTSYSVPCIFQCLFSIVYSLLCTCTVYCVLYTMCYVLNTVYYLLITIPFTVYYVTCSVNCVLFYFSVLCTLYQVLVTVQLV